MKLLVPFFRPVWVKFDSDNLRVLSLLLLAFPNQKGDVAVGCNSFLNSAAQQLEDYSWLYPLQFLSLSSLLSLQIQASQFNLPYSLSQQTLPQRLEKRFLCLKGNHSLQPSDCSQSKPLAGQTLILSEGVDIKRRLCTRWWFPKLYLKSHNKAQDQHILIVLFIPFFHINFFPMQACPSLLEINCTQTSARYFCVVSFFSVAKTPTWVFVQNKIK